MHRHTPAVRDERENDGDMTDEALLDAVTLQNAEQCISPQPSKHD